MREIYMIIDKDNKDAYCSTIHYKHRNAAERKIHSLMTQHVRSMMKKVQKMTGTVRGKNVQEFNNCVESVANPRFVIKEIRLNTDW